MTDKVQKIREEVERLKEWQPIASPSLNKLLSFIDSLQEESPTVYVITRCEEHSDYVEKVFLDYNKAVDYCGQFEGKEDEYGRDITKIEVTL